MARPYVVGLTGGLASGKNLVCDVLRECGATVIDADQVSRALVRAGSPLLAEIASIWGTDVVRSDGELDRPLLASRVFGHPDQVARLNQVTHPPILQEMQRLAAASQSPVVVLVGPLLREADAMSLIDELWVVTAPRQVRLRRAMQRDHSNEENAQARMDAQLDDSEQAHQADVVISNAGEADSTRAQVRAAWNCLQERVAHAAGR